MTEIDALQSALDRIETHNGEPVTADNLRWAATHGALCKSWVFDVLTGLADEITPVTPRGLHPCEGCGLELDGDDPNDRCEECVLPPDMGKPCVVGDWPLRYAGRPGVALVVWVAADELVEVE